MFPVWRGAGAADDLLDLNKIGSTRRAADSADLLDPDQLGAKVVRNAGARVQRESKFKPPGYARAMASSVTRSLLGLIDAAVALQSEIGRLEAEESRLRGKLQSLEAEKDAKLEEYRQGLFCSGCNRTKSEILARGEQFPHPGQHIVRPTPEQIAAKERELQAPIDKTDAALREVIDKLDKARAWLGEAKIQIRAGLALWRTSVIFESDLIDAHDKEQQDRYKAELAPIQAQLGKLRSDPVSPDRARQAAAARDLNTWTELEENLNQARKTGRRQYREQLELANLFRKREEGELTQALLRAEWLTEFSVYYHYVLAITSFEAKGGIYRMGNHDPARNGEILASVREFLSHT